MDSWKVRKIRISCFLGIEVSYKIIVKNILIRWCCVLINKVRVKEMKYRKKFIESRNLIYYSGRVWGL